MNFSHYAEKKKMAPGIRLHITNRTYGEADNYGKVKPIPAVLTQRQKCSFLVTVVFKA